MVSTVMVITMAFLAAIMFLVADLVISRGIAFILGVGTGTGVS